MRLRELAKRLSQVEDRLPHEVNAVKVIDLESCFTQEELQRYVTFVERVRHRMGLAEYHMRDYTLQASNLTDAELEEAETWALLYKQRQKR